MKNAESSNEAAVVRFASREWLAILTCIIGLTVYIVRNEGRMLQNSFSIVRHEKALINIDEKFESLIRRLDSIVRQEEQISNLLQRVERLEEKVGR